MPNRQLTHRYLQGKPLLHCYSLGYGSSRGYVKPAAPSNRRKKPGIRSKVTEVTLTPKGRRGYGEERPVAGVRLGFGRPFQRQSRPSAKKSTVPGIKERGERQGSSMGDRVDAERGTSVVPRADGYLSDRSTAALYHSTGGVAGGWGFQQPPHSDGDGTRIRHPAQTQRSASTRVVRSRKRLVARSSVTTCEIGNRGVRDSQLTPEGGPTRPQPALS